jgi:hypothetical protein
VLVHGVEPRRDFSPEPKCGQQLRLTGGQLVAEFRRDGANGGLDVEPVATGFQDDARRADVRQNLVGVHRSSTSVVP